MGKKSFDLTGVYSAGHGSGEDEDDDGEASTSSLAAGSLGCRLLRLFVDMV